MLSFLKDKKSFNKDINIVLEELFDKYNKIKKFSKEDVSEEIKKYNLIIAITFLNSSVMVSSIDDNIISFVMRQKDEKEINVYTINKYDLIFNKLPKFCKITNIRDFINFDNDIDVIIDRTLYLILSENLKEVLENECNSLTSKELKRLWSSNSF